MGLTYTSKPVYIDRMIEVGSHHFFMAFGHLNLAAAEAEIGENIGPSRKAGTHLDEAVWHLKKTIELYRDLITSIEPLPVSDDVKNILSSFDFHNFQHELAKSDTIKILEDQWNEFVKAAQKIDPVGVIKKFVEKVENIQPVIDDAQKSLKMRGMNSVALHASLSRFIDALVFGQYIAEFNRTSREMFAKEGR